MKTLVFIQTENNKINNISLESLVAAQKIKDSSNGEVHAVIFNNSLIKELEKYDLNSIIKVTDNNLENYSPLHYLETFYQLHNSINPDVFIFGHSYETRDWVPRLSAKLDIPFISDCISCEFNSGKLNIKRPIYQAKIIQDITITSNCSILSFQAGSYSSDDLKEGTASINEFSADFSSVNSSIKPGEKFSETTGGVDLTSAEIIVSIGRGIGKEENIPLAEDFANKINAQIGASRPVVDSGWLDHSRQIGSSGQVVSPKLYFSIGISGAIQHLVGMKGSKNIIAINKDPNAPIFEIADYAVIGDVLEILPKLSENL